MSESEISATLFDATRHVLAAACNDESYFTDEERAVLEQSETLVADYQRHQECDSDDE